MELVQSRVNKLAQRIAERNLVDRHRQQTRQLYETVYGVSPSSTVEERDLDVVFKRSIQARANPLTENEYHTVLETVQPREVLSTDSRQEAFQKLCDADHIGQKIANEFLRQSVHVLGINEEWIEDLAVPLDTHVVQALVKTGAIRLDESQHDRRPGEIINMNPGSNPYKRVGYREVQDAFQVAVHDAGFPRIIFDELWLEHRHFIADPLLQSESEFYDLIQDRYRYDEDS